MKSQKESLRLEEAGLTGDVLDSAISSFILEVNFLPSLCGYRMILNLTMYNTFCGGELIYITCL